MNEKALAIASAVRAAGGRALVVGGWVRDRLLGHESKDIDIEVFGIDAARLRTLLESLGRVETVGESFQVYKCGDVDVSLPRRESKAGRGHRGFVVTGDPSMSIEEAARRRDFTINAISFDPLTGEYLDPFDGRGDLAHRRLRVVDWRTFADDSLRVLRAVQFAARFELTVDDETRAICRAVALDDLPPERVWGEVENLLGAARPSVGLALALDLGVVASLFPELHALVGCIQEPEWHPEGDVWVHTLQVVDQARTRVDDLPRPQRLAIMLGAVCHDFGKPATTAFIDGRIRSIDHEEQGVAPASRFLDRLNVHSFDGYDVRAQVLGMTAHHLKPGMWFKVKDEVGDGAFRRLAQKVDLDLLARLAKSDCLGREPGTFNCQAMDWFLDRAHALGVEHQPPAPILLGRHLLPLGVRPGPRMGEILKAVYERQLDGLVTTLDEATAAAREMLARTSEDPPPRCRGCSRRAHLVRDARLKPDVHIYLLRRLVRRARRVGRPDLDRTEVQLLQFRADLRAIADHHEQHLLRHEILPGGSGDLCRGHAREPRLRAGVVIERQIVEEQVGRGVGHAAAGFEPGGQRAHRGVPGQREFVGGDPLAHPRQLLRDLGERRRGHVGPHARGNHKVAR
jgi:tRNA nucleotidyltransferase (CCA-adding enzyme)